MNFENLRGQHRFWTCFRISQNTPISYLSCTKKVRGRHKGHPEAHFHWLNYFLKFMEMWKFERFLKNRFFSKYEIVVEVFVKLEHFHTPKVISGCSGQTGETNRRNPVFITLLNRSIPTVFFERFFQTQQKIVKIRNNKK